MAVTCAKPRSPRNRTCWLSWVPCTARAQQFQAWLCWHRVGLCRGKSAQDLARLTAVSLARFVSLHCCVAAASGLAAGATTCLGHDNDCMNTNLQIGGSRHAGHHFPTCSSRLCSTCQKRLFRLRTPHVNIQFLTISCNDSALDSKVISIIRKH